MIEITQAQQKRLNERLAPLINTTYVLAIVIEGITTDMKLERLRKVAIKIRSEIYGASPNHAESFGDWGDEVERRLLAIGERREVLYILCDKFYRMAQQMEQTYRQIDPLFEFYQIKEAKQLLAYTKGKKLNTELYKQINQVINDIKKEK
jgi:type II secretory pathway component PulF